MTSASILFVIFVFVLAKHFLDTKAKHDRERLRMIEDALKQGNLDDQSREILMGSLTGRRPEPPRQPAPARAPRSPNEVGFFFKFMAFLGWLAFCVGIAFVIIVSNMRGYDDLAVPATILSCTGFGLLTFPFVLRELGAPRRAAAAQPRS